MSETLRPAGSRSWARWGLFGLSVLALSPAGCTSMSQDVDAYYRQMAFNYKEAAGKGEDRCGHARKRDEGARHDGRLLQSEESPAPARAASRPGRRSARRKRSDSRRPPSGQRLTSTWKSPRFPTSRRVLRPWKTPRSCRRGSQGSRERGS